MAESPADTKIFVSYSHHDVSYTRDDSLLGFLRGLENEGATFWWDSRLKAGDVWDSEIKRQLLQADIALALVSQWFLDSQYIRNVEVRSFLERIKNDGLIVFPVIVSACDWMRYGWLDRLHHLPEGDKNLAEHYSRRGPRERMFSRIRTDLRASLKSAAPAALAIEATSGAINCINSLEPQYRSVVAQVAEESLQHSLRYEGLGTEVRVIRRGHVERSITEADLRQLSPAELENITTMQKAMRRFHDRWVSLYDRRNEASVEKQLQALAADMAPDLKATIENLERFGLDLEDHYRRFYDFVEQHLHS